MCSSFSCFLSYLFRFFRLWSLPISFDKSGVVGGGGGGGGSTMSSVEYSSISSVGGESGADNVGRLINVMVPLREIV